MRLLNHQLWILPFDQATQQDLAFVGFQNCKTETHGIRSMDIGHPTHFSPTQNPQNPGGKSLPIKSRLLVNSYKVSPSPSIERIYGLLMNSGGVSSCFFSNPQPHHPILPSTTPSHPATRVVGPLCADQAIASWMRGLLK